MPARSRWGLDVVYVTKYPVTPQATKMRELLWDTPAPWAATGSLARLAAVVMTTFSVGEGERKVTPVWGVPACVQPGGYSTLKAGEL